MTPPAPLSSVASPIVPDAPVDLISWQDAAAQRGYGYRDVWAAPTLTGVLFREGRNAIATDVVDALSSPAPFIAGTLTATYGAASAEVSASFIGLPLSRSMSSMLLVGDDDGALGRTGINLGTWQMLALKGEFDSLFTLYRPLRKPAVASEVFSPELIEMFLRIMPGSDAELAEDWVFVYGDAGRNTSRDSLDRIERVAARVHEAIVRRNFDELHEEAAESVKAARGKGQVALFSAVLAATSVAAGALAWLAMLGH